MSTKVYQSTQTPAQIAKEIKQQIANALNKNPDLGIGINQDDDVEVNSEKLAKFIQPILEESIKETLIS
jgi:hypothetical protein